VSAANTMRLKANGIRLRKSEPFVSMRIEFSDDDEVLEGRYLFGVMALHAWERSHNCHHLAMQILQHVLADADCKGQTQTLSPLKGNIYQNCTTLTGENFIDALTDFQSVASWHQGSYKQDVGTIPYYAIIIATQVLP
jgi:hypothetical protein